jgi:hypothetical protein
MVAWLGGGMDARRPYCTVNASSHVVEEFRRAVLRANRGNYGHLRREADNALRSWTQHLREKPGQACTHHATAPAEPPEPESDPTDSLGKATDSSGSEGVSP